MSGVDVESVVRTIATCDLDSDHEIQRLVAQLKRE